MLQSEIPNNEQKTQYYLNIKNWVILHREKVLQGVLALFIFLFAIFGLTSLGQPVVAGEEFSNWAVSFSMIGKDWSAAVNGIKDFSLGYSLLLLPFSFLLTYTADMYRCVIIINGFLLVFSYVLSLKITERLCPEFNWIIKSVVCFAAIIYPSNIVYSHTSLPETLITFLFWFFAFVLLNAIEKPSSGNYFLLAFSAGSLFIVQERTLPVLAAAIIAVVYMSIQKLNNKRHIYVFVGTLLASILFYSVGKYILYHELNMDFSSLQVGKIADNLLKFNTIEGWQKFLQGIVGKCMYLALSTCLLLFWGVTDIIREAADSVKGIFSGHDRNQDNNKTPGCVWKYLMLFILFGTILISSIYNLEITGIDTLLNGKYCEYILGIFFIYSYYCIVRDKIWETHLLWYLIILMPGGFLCQYILDNFKLFSFSPWESLNLASFFTEGMLPVAVIFEIIIYFITFSMVLILLIKLKAVSNLQNARVMLGVILTICIWGYISVTFMQEQVFLKNSETLNNVIIIQKINELESDTVVKFPLYTDDSFYIENIQFMLPDRKIVLFKESELILKEGECYIIENFIRDSIAFDDYFTVLGENNRFTVALVK